MSTIMFEFQNIDLFKFIDRMQVRRRIRNANSNRDGEFVRILFELAVWWSIHGFWNFKFRLFIFEIDNFFLNSNYFIFGINKF